MTTKCSCCDGGAITMLHTTDGDYALCTACKEDVDRLMEPYITALANHFVAGGGVDTIPDPDEFHARKTS